MAAERDDLPAFTLETGTSVEALRDAKAESRAALDHRVRLLYEIDEQAMRSVRTAVVLFGVLASAVGIIGQVGTLYVDGWTLAFATTGVLSLLACVFVGVGATSISATDFGIGTSYRQDVRQGDYSEREWLRTVLHGHDEWEAELEAVNDRKEVYVFVSQPLLLVAFVCLPAAVGLSTMPH